ncbi:MAG TPA: hypothetical protein VFQ16_07335, partial [Burkholderiaceae bacterium]|nr:hypothetical protein [Burkholderiaceae bacterium]
LWPLPLMAALLPTLAALVALFLFNEGREVPCNPFVADCVSISRMARHGLANLLFRLLVITGAVLQALTWLVAARVFACGGLARRDALVMALLGAGAAAMLAVYAAFLGSEGAAYRWLRRSGTLSYFGGTFLAMLLFARAAQFLDRARSLATPRAWLRVQRGLLAFVTAIALAHAFASLAKHAGVEDRIENLTEWWGALALMLGFAAMAWLWRHWRVRATLEVAAPRS